eukprot:2682126-Rhodomonas_salina.1
MKKEKQGGGERARTGVFGNEGGGAAEGSHFHVHCEENVGQVRLVPPRTTRQYQRLASSTNRASSTHNSASTSAERQYGARRSGTEAPPMRGPPLVLIIFDIAGQISWYKCTQLQYQTLRSWRVARYARSVPDIARHTRTETAAYALSVPDVYA